MIIISDSSPIVSLAHLQKLNLLKELYTEIILPKTVYEELLHSKIIKVNFLQTHNYFFVKSALNIELVEKLNLLIDKGEAEAIALSIELKPELLLIDEFEGRKIAKQNNIPIKGVLDVLVIAKEKGLIENVKPHIDQLRNEILFRIKDEIYFEILKQANEL
jgi:uncharacterized protein